MSLPRIFPAALLLSFAAAAAAAEEKAPKIERATYRVTGLFAPDREKDLRAGFKEIADVNLLGIDFDNAEITVEFTPAKAFPGAKSEQYVEQLNQKVGNATRHTFGVKPRRTVPRDKLQQVVIPADGCDCKACCLAAYEIVARIDGVYQATASFKEGRITALIDPAKTDRAQLEAALKQRGVSVGKP
jgi:copper chaperone CopZ